MKLISGKLKYIKLGSKDKRYKIVIDGNFDLQFLKTVEKEKVKDEKDTKKIIKSYQDLLRNRDIEIILK